MKKQDVDTWEDFEKELFKQKGFVEAVEETRLEFDIARALIRAKIEKGYTQKTLAKKLNTPPAVVSRVESGKMLPSLSFLKRLAHVLNASLQVHFTPSK